VKTHLSLTTGAISTVKSVTARLSFVSVNIVDGGQFHVLAALSAGHVGKKIM
jgi:hypothetical protein